jgi:hypothetical protein
VSIRALQILLTIINDKSNGDNQQLYTIVNSSRWKKSIFALRNWYGDELFNKQMLLALDRIVDECKMRNYPVHIGVLTRYASIRRRIVHLDPNDTHYYKIYLHNDTDEQLSTRMCARYDRDLALIANAGYQVKFDNRINNNK